MDKIAKKLAVFMAVKSMQDWISLSELLAYLGEDYAERSVRRWLNMLITEGLLEKKGQKKGTLYKAYPAPIFPQAMRMLFTDEDAIAINYVKQPLYLRKPVTYQRQWLDVYEPNKTFYLSIKSVLCIVDSVEKY